MFLLSFAFTNFPACVCDCSFGLFEAMSAIEMMDPKMDAGMMCNQAKHPVLNLEQSIEVRQAQRTGGGGLSVRKYYNVYI